MGRRHREIETQIKEMLDVEGIVLEYISYYIKNIIKVNNKNIYKFDILSRI